MDRRRIPGDLRRTQRDPGGMAAEGRGPVATAGRGDRARGQWRRAQRELALVLRARAEMRDARRAGVSVRLIDFLKLLLLALLIVAATPLLAAEKIVATRVWPSQEYTRVTLESGHAIKYQTFFVSDPQRLVVDLEGVELNAELKSLPTRIGDNDPYIRTVRVGLNRPGVMRVVFDLRTEVKPSVFALAPAGEYKHRLVLDIYPAHPLDPLLALVSPKTDPIAEIGRAPVIASAESGAEKA